MKLTKIFILVLLVAAIAVYFTLDLGLSLSLPHLKEKQQAFQAYCAESPMKTIGAYLLLYVLLAALSIPGATIVTLAGGALFGVWLGSAIVLFAASIVTTVAFLVSRNLLQDCQASWQRRHEEAGAWRVTSHSRTAAIG